MSHEDTDGCFTPEHLRAAKARAAEYADWFLNNDAAALGYATRLAESIWRKHYSADAPSWKPLPDMLGVLTQIDNMISGLTRVQCVSATPPLQSELDGNSLRKKQSGDPHET